MISGGISITLILAAWLWSFVTVFSRPAPALLRSGIVFPLTNPIALIILAVLDFRACRVPLALYLTATVLFLSGGAIGHHRESQRYERYLTQLQEAGGRLDLADWRAPDVADPENVWGHPFLKPLAEAAKSTGQGQTRGFNPTYKRLSAPPIPLRTIVYDKQLMEQAINGPRFLHERSVAYLIKTDPQRADSDLPKTWPPYARLIFEHYVSGEDDFQKLREAALRPQDVFPLEWERGYDLSLPQLKTVKNFTLSTALRAIAQAINGNSDKAFQELMLTFRLATLSQQDLLISRLVQIAQVNTTLQAIHAGQQFHLWDDTQWQAIDQRLADLQLPDLLADALRGERFISHIHLSQIIQSSNLTAMSKSSFLNAYPNESGETRSKALIQGTEAFLGNHLRALLIRQWTEALRGYEEMIQQAELAASNLRTQPWMNQAMTLKYSGPKGYGIIGSMVLPAFGNALSRVLNEQARIELTRVAIALERYRIEYGRYPDEIHTVFEEFKQIRPQDPMTLGAWQYKRDSSGGFKLYSVGRNGRDDKGAFTPASWKGNKDDLEWSILGDEPPIPRVTINRSRSGRGQSAED